MPGGYGQFVDLVKPSQLGTEFMDIARCPAPTAGTARSTAATTSSSRPRPRTPSGAWEFIQWVLQTQQQDQYPALGYTPVRTDVLTPAFKAKNPDDAVALKALAKGYAPVTLVYDADFNEPNSPVVPDVHHGGLRREHDLGALQQGQSGWPGSCKQAARDQSRRVLTVDASTLRPSGSRAAGSAASGLRGAALRRRSARGPACCWSRPAFAMVAVFVLFPLGFAVYISLTNWPLIGPYHFIGRPELPPARRTTRSSSTRSLFTLHYTAIVTGPIFLVGYAHGACSCGRTGSARRSSAPLFFLPFIVGLATESASWPLLELQPDSGAADYVLSQGRPRARDHRVDGELRPGADRHLRDRRLVRRPG